MTRREAREYMMITCYQMDLVGGFDVDRHDEFFKDVDMGKQNNYLEILFSLICNKIEEIDKAIQDHSEKWDLSRIPKTDLAALRVGVAELLFIEDVPDNVAVNEAVELTKNYGEENSSAYVNGILGAILKEKQEKNEG